MIPLAPLPSQVVAQVREMSQEAFRRANDPVNRLADDPRIVEEWLAVGVGLQVAAADIERRVDLALG